MGRTDIQTLYQSHAAALLGYLRRSFSWCGSPEDLLQETFLQAIRQEPRLAKAESQRAFLFGIARHVGLTAARRYRPSTPVDETAVPAPAADPRLADMRQAIAALPSAMKEALELRLREGLTYEEISQMLEIPLGTVRSRLHAAMLKLRQDLQSE